MKKWAIYLMRFVLISISVILIAWLVIYIYFRSHKNEILQKTIAAINKNIHGDILIKDIGLDFPGTFPYVSINLQEIIIRDTLYSVHHHDLVNAKKFLLRTNPFQLITGKFEISKIQVEHGNIYVYDDSTGYSSFKAFEQQTDSSLVKKSALKKEIRSFRFIDMKVTIDKPFKNKLFVFDVEDLDCDMDRSGDLLLFDLNTDLVIESLAFNLTKGSFAEHQPLTGHFQLAFNIVAKELSFQDITLRIGKEPYHFTGKFQFINGKKFNLLIKAPKADFTRAAALLPINIRRNIDSIEFNKPLAVEAAINGQLQSGIQPLVRVMWTVKDSRISTPFGTFEKAAFDGFFYNQLIDTLPPKGENSIIQLNNFTGKWENVDLQAKKMTITNLKHPILTCDLHASAQLLTLNQLLESESLEFGKGSIDAAVVYSGPVYDSATTAPNINGTASIKSGALLYGPRQIQMDQLNGDMVFKGTDVYFKNIRASAQGNSVLLNITAINLLALMNSDPSKAQLEASVYSPQIDISKFTTFLGSRKKIIKKNKGRPKFARMAARIDRLLDQCNIRSDINAEKITFKRFTATNFKANIFLNNEVWALHNTVLNHAGGIITLNGAIRGGSKNYNPVKINATMSDVDIAKTFYAFDNFGLRSLTAKNLAGKLNSTINLTAALLDKAEMVPSSLRGSISLSLKNGALNNFEPLEKMSVFLFKNRDFSHVNFSEIKNTFDFNGRMVHINRMEIQSNVLSLFMEGLYDIDGKATDLVIQVPLSNLKKREPGYVPENQGVERKTGASIFVKAKNNEKGDIDFSYSLFNKRKAKKEKNNQKSNRR